MPTFLKALCILLTTISVCGALHAREPLAEWGDDAWRLQLDPATGALVRIEHKGDSPPMNWLREPGHWERRNWTADPSVDAAASGGQWGLIETSQTGLLHAASVRQISEKAWEAVYVSPSLIVTARRELTPDDALAESYVFKNTGFLALEFPLGSVAFAAPFFDQYPDAARSLTARCHAHLWMGGASAWINAEHMGVAVPHLGLVVTQGSLDAYSQRGGTISDRGTFLLHPAPMKLAAGQSQTVAWRLFWHHGWEDFFAKLRENSNGFVRLSAKRYTVTAGEPLEVAAESASSLASAKLLVNGQPVEAHSTTEGRLSVTIPTAKPGELLVELLNHSQRTWLRANVTPPSDEIIASRVRFIVQRQQRRAEGDPLDGAYLSYDNETRQQVYDAKTSDHNAGRERLAMGVLGALYLPLCRDEAFKTELKSSLARCAAFLARELEDDEGVVYGSVGRTRPDRLYNFPWSAQFHLAMYHAMGDASELDRFVRVCRTYYAREGVKFYAIGLPVTDGLKALADAGRIAERAELLADFRAHADRILQAGTNYPKSEVNYEQSIVAPAVQLLLEVYLATGENIYLEGAKRQMPLLEAFAGQQSDFRLNEVPIRHWDDYWFGKMRLYGDTFPHYWSTLNGVAYAYYARATSERGWFTRADAVLSANLSLFAQDGSASCAHVYPLMSNGQPTSANDPWANDQDWALVHLLTVHELERE